MISRKHSFFFNDFLLECLELLEWNVYKEKNLFFSSSVNTFHLNFQFFFRAKQNINPYLSAVNSNHQNGSEIKGDYDTVENDRLHAQIKGMKTVKKNYSLKQM